MRLLPASIAGRFLTLLFASILILHLGSIGLYHLGLEAELDVTNEQRLAERLVSVKRAIAHEALEKREDLAHALSGGPLEIHWSDKAEVPPAGVDGERTSLKEKLLAADPSLSPSDITIGAAAALPDHASATKFLLVSMRLSDSTWVDVTATRNIEPRTSLTQIAFSTTIMVLGVLTVAAFLIRQITRSLRGLADAAEHLDPHAESTPVDVGGSSEVRALAVAFNEMQQRVKRLLDDRTQTLAAISHDLKTPITRLRLRSEDIGDAELARSVISDLAEMQAMLDSTLAFLRGDQVAEPKKDIDLGSLLETISTDLSDLGHEVTFSQGIGVAVPGRHLALKRALWNIAENAVKYGLRANITLSAFGTDAVVTIDDEGPGIPDVEKEAVLRPFYRIDDSRNRETGGVGLGLAVAHSIIRSHAGDLRFSDRPGGGLRVTVVLPFSRQRPSPEIN